jgi:hypothetical protein
MKKRNNVLDDLLSKPVGNGMALNAERELETFDDEGYKVKRRKNHSKENHPAVTFKHGSFVFNAHAIRILDECKQIQILINRQKKFIVVRPCDEYLYDSVQWSRVDKLGNIVPKTIFAKPFTGLVFYEMYWDFKGTKKISGKQVKDRDVKMLQFDMTDEIAPKC